MASPHVGQLKTAILAFEECPLNDEGASFEVVKVEMPDGAKQPYLKLVLTSRQLGPQLPGSELTTRQVLTLDPAYAKVVAARMAEQIDLAERPGSSK